jgi:hypothetical protein
MVILQPADSRYFSEEGELKQCTPKPEQLGQLEIPARARYQPMTDAG